MNKIIFCIALLTSLAGMHTTATAQFIPFQSAQYRHLAADTLYNLTGNGAPGTTPNSYKRVVWYYDSTNHINYQWQPENQSWAAFGGGSIDTSSLQPLVAGYGLIGSTYDGSTPQTWIVDTSVLNRDIINYITNVDTSIWVVHGIYNAPPGGAVNGDIFLVGTSPTGAFAGHANERATNVGGTYSFDVPTNKKQLINDDATNSIYNTYQYDLPNTLWNLSTILVVDGGNRLGAQLVIGTKDNFLLAVWVNNKETARFNADSTVQLKKLVGTDSTTQYLTANASGVIRTGTFHVLTVDTTRTSGGAFIRNDTLFVPKISGGSGGSTNLNIGSGYRIAVSNTNNIKTIFAGSGVIIDSTTNANSLTLSVMGTGTDTIIVFHSDTIYANKKLVIPKKDTSTFVHTKAQLDYQPSDNHFYGDNGTMWLCLDCMTDTTALHAELVQIISQQAINTASIATKVNITDTANKWVTDVRRIPGSTTVEKQIGGAWLTAFTDSSGTSGGGGYNQDTANKFQKNGTVIFRKSFFTNFTDFNSKGSLDTSILNGTLLLKGGSPDTSKYLILKNTKNQDEYTERIVSYKIDSLGGGLWVGARSFNTTFGSNYRTSVYGRFNATTGILYAFNNSGITIASTSTGITAAVNDVCNISYLQRGVSVYIYFQDITQTGTTIYKLIVPDYTIPNANEFVIGDWGGKYEIQSVSFNSYSARDANITVFGDSKQNYFSNDIKNRFSNLLNAGIVNLFAGASDGIYEDSACLPYWLTYFKTQYVILDALPRNDDAAGINSAFWQPRYHYIDSVLEANCFVITGLPSPEGAAQRGLQTVVKTYLSTYPHTVDPATPSPYGAWKTQLYNSIDSIHLSELGMARKAAIYNASGYFPMSNEKGIDNTSLFNSFNYIAGKHITIGAGNAINLDTSKVPTFIPGLKVKDTIASVSNAAFSVNKTGTFTGGTQTVTGSSFVTSLTITGGNTYNRNAYFSASGGTAATSIYSDSGNVLISTLHNPSTNSYQTAKLVTEANADNYAGVFITSTTGTPSSGSYPLVSVGNSSQPVFNSITNLGVGGSGIDFGGSYNNLVYRNSGLNWAWYIYGAGDTRFYQSIFHIHDDGRVSLGTQANAATSSPVAWLQLPLSTTAYASLNVGAGTAPTSPNHGDIWTNTNHLLIRLNGVTYQLDQPLATRVSTQFDKTSSTTLANITGLTATLLAGATYKFEAILYTTSNSGGGVQFAIGGTATATNIIYEDLVSDANVNAAQTRATALATAVGGITAVTNAYSKITGTITVNAAGTLTVQFAQNASNGTASSVLVGSTFVITQMN